MEGFMENELDKLLNELTEDKKKDLSVKIYEILKKGCWLFGLEIGILSKILDNDYFVINVYTHDNSLKMGAKFQLDSTYCQIIYMTGSTICFGSIENSEWSDHPAYKKFNLKSYFGAPLYVNRKLYGTINYSSSKIIDSNFVKPISICLEKITKWTNSQLADNKDSMSMCNHLCNNYSSICSSPLGWCSDKNYKTDNSTETKKDTLLYNFHQS